MNTKLLSALLTASLIVNVTLGWRFSVIAKKLVEKEQAVQVVTNNYYGLFNRVNNYLEAISNSAKKQGFFERIFGSESRVPELNMEDFKDPYKVHKE